MAIYYLKLNIDSDETGQKANKQTSLKRTNFQRTQSGEHMFLFDHVTRTMEGTVGSAAMDDKMSFTTPRVETDCHYFCNPVINVNSPRGSD